MLRLTLALLLGSLLAGEARAQKTLQPRPVAGANNDLDVNYLQPWRDVLLHSERGPEYQTRLNVHWPKGDGPFPCLIFVHGGGYGGGHRDIAGAGTGGGAKLIDLAVERGFVAVNVNYILGEQIFPQVFYDFRAAVRFLRKNADRYRIDPNRMAAWGHSAGGWLISTCNYPDAGQYMLSHNNATPNGWSPPTPEEFASLKPGDPAGAPVRFALGRKQLLAPLDDAQPLYGEYSSRLQAMVFDFLHCAAAGSPDDPATLIFVGEGAEPRDFPVLSKQGVRVFSAVATDDRYKGNNVLHVPNFFSPSVGADGKTPMPLYERVFEFLKTELVADPRTPAPEFRPNPRLFKDRTQVELVVPTPDLDLFYTLDGSEPTPASSRYAGPVALEKTTTIKALALRKGWRPSGVASATYVRGVPPPAVVGPDQLPAARVGQPYAVSFKSDASAASVKWTLALALPPHAQAFAEQKKAVDAKELREKGAGLLLGLAMKSQGVLSGTPVVAGNYVVQVQVGRDYGQVATTRTYVLQVAP